MGLKLGEIDWCKACGELQPKPVDGVRRRCPQCETEHKDMLRKETATKTMKAISTAINRAGTRSPLLGAVLSRVTERLGGQDAFADLLVEDINRVRGVGLTDEELCKFRYRPDVVLNYHKMMLVAISAENAQRAAAGQMSDMTEQDMTIELRHVALEALRIDPTFRSLALEIIREVEPELLLGLAGQPLIEQRDTVDA